MNNEFANYNQEQRERALMESVIRCTEVADALELGGRIDVSLEDNYDRWACYIELAHDFEEECCGTERYENDFTNLSAEFFTEKLIEIYGDEQDGTK